MTPDSLLPEALDQTLAQERALRAAQQWPEAEALLNAAVAAWPNDERVLIDWGVLAHEQMHWPDMAQRFAVLRARRPGHLFGYSRGGEALRWLERFDEAEAVISEGVPRFSDALELLIQWVLVACDRADWPAAEARAETLLARQPDAMIAYWFAAEPFRRRKRHAEADAVLGEALHRVGLDPVLVLRFAEAASLREDWPAAARRWAAARKHLPHLPMTHRALATALTHLGRLWEADAAIGAAIHRFPEEKDLAVEHAWLAVHRQAWEEARLRWEALRARYPQDAAIDAGRMHVAAMTDAELAAPATQRATTAGPAPHDEIMADPARLLAQFESLGESCEFGLLQRHFGIEPISLMRWSATDYRQLMQALETDFLGLGDPANTQLGVGQHDEYIVNDRRLGFDMHTFVKASQVDRARFLDTQAKRLRFLVRKFREDAAAAERIFVRCTDKPTTPEQIRLLHRALRRYGPVTLLHVTEPVEPGRASPVEWLDRDLMVGFIDHLGRPPEGGWDISYEGWLGILRAAFALRQAPPR